MALPGNTASTLPLPGNFLLPDAAAAGGVVDYERGGQGVGNATGGLDLYDWTCYVEASVVKVVRDGVAPTDVFTQSGITRLSFAFDLNMRPSVAYTTSDGNVYLRWYDSVVENYVITNFGAGRSPCMTLDDKRAFNSANADVILAYITSDQLVYRQQRDRYNTVRVLDTGVANDTVLRNIGMGDNLRLIFEYA